MKIIHHIILLVFLSFPLMSVAEKNVELCTNTAFLNCMKLEQNECYTAQKQAMSNCFTKHPFEINSSKKDNVKSARGYSTCIMNEYLTNLGSNVNTFTKCLEKSNSIKYYKNK